MSIPPNRAERTPLTKQFSCEQPTIVIVEATMSWKIDPAHSQVEFSVRHMMISNVRGRFEKFDGTLEFDEENLSTMRVDIEISAASINTRDQQRDAHLTSPDFLNA